MPESTSPIMGGVAGSPGRRVVQLIAAAGMALVASAAFAQTGSAAGSAGLGLSDAGASEVVAASSHRSTLGRMFRRITADFNENKLEDVVKFLEDFSGATIEVQWAEDGAEGLNREQPITLKIRNLPVLTALERVLAKSGTDSLAGGATWQMTEYGALEVGPKSVLNRTKRTELYDIHDLLMEIPRYDEVPQIDLQSLLQQSQQGGGGGGGQSPFTGNQEQETNVDRRSLQEKGEEIIKLITTLVEPEEWIEGGGEGGTIRYYNGNILVNAPDYMHRQISGYSYWPSHTSKVVAGRRYVSLGTDNSIGTIDGFTNVPVSAIVGGRPVSSDPGGGGSNAPSPTPAPPGGKKTGPGGSKAPATAPSTTPGKPQPGGQQGPATKQPVKKDQKK